MKSKIKKSLQQARDWIWADDYNDKGGLFRALIFLLRLLVAIVRDVAHGELTLRATSLVYTTLMSFVPLLAVSFSVLKGFGVHNFLDQVLYELLAPLGSKGLEIGNNILGFIENIKVGVLGAVGIVFLLFTVISLIQKIETAFNFVWRIERLRSVGQRFSDYLSVVFVGPMLVFMAIAITASINNNTIVQSITAIEPFGALFVVAGKLVPFLFVILAFTFVYSFLPNTRVQLKSAFAGGVVAGTMWQALSLSFATFVESFTNFSAIYSGFAIIIVLLIWLYIGWFILLLGGSVAYYVQFPSMMRFARNQLVISGQQRESIGLSMMLLITEHFTKNVPLLSESELANRLHIPENVATEIIDDLINGALIKATMDEPTSYIPARDIRQISIFDILSVLRKAGSEPSLIAADSVTEAAREMLLEMESNSIDRWSTCYLSDCLEKTGKG